MPNLGRYVIPSSWILFVAFSLAGCELVSPPPTNQAPVIASIAGAAAVDMGASTALSCDASDSDGDALSYSWSATTGALSSTTGQSITWTAPESDQGATISCTVSDGNQHSATKTKIMTVNPVNRPVKNLAVVNGNRQLTLRWINPTASTFAGVQIQRSTTGLVSSVTMGTMVYSGSDQSFTDIDLANETAFYYSIFTLDTKGTYSIPATISGKPNSDTTAPGAPSSPSAVAGDNALTLSWGLPTDPDFAGVVLLRKNTSSPADITDGVKLLDSATATSYTDTSLTNGTSYYYAIYAYDAASNYSIPATIIATPRGDVTPPAAPLDFVALPGDSQVSLSWSLPANADLAGVMLLRKTGSFSASPSDGTVILDSVGAASFGDTVLSNGTSYYYSLYAYDRAGNYSAPATTTSMPTNDTNPPGDVLSFGAIPGNAKVFLSWKSPGDSDFAGVSIIRKAGAQPSSKTDGTQVYSGNATSYVDSSGAKNGTTWWYRAFSYDLSGNFASGVAVSATPASDILATYKMSLIDTFNSPDTQPMAVGYDGSMLWLAGGANEVFYKIDPSTGEVLESHNCQTLVGDHGYYYPGVVIWNLESINFAFKDSTAYTIQTGGKYLKLDLANNSSSVTLSGFPDWSRGIVFDGSYGWAINGDASIVKFDGETGQTVLTFSSPLSSNNTGLALSNDGKQLYIANHVSNKIYIINKADASLLGSINLPYAASIGGYAVRGLCNDGTHIWLTDLNTQKIYKCMLTVLQ